MSVTLETSKELSVIHLEGTIGIAEAGELKHVLLQALQSKGDVRVSLQHVTDVDVTAVQLLWTAQREARSAGVVFTFAGTVPEEVSASLADAGFDKFPVSDQQMTS